jgi:uncharacterized protein (DUF934 family)
MQISIRNRQIVDKPSPPDLVLQPADDPSTLAGSLALVRVIAVNFPKFGDGRGYSIARLLRERYGYPGELRAVGEVGRDNLFFMAQCGFDAFELRAGEDPQEALAALGEFSTLYASTAVQPRPLFRRRPIARPAFP